MDKLDEIDRKLLRRVQRDADLGVEALGAEIGLSRNACWRRLKRLEEIGVIRRRVALLDADALGLGLTVFIAVLVMVTMIMTFVSTHAQDVKFDTLR